MIVLPRPLAITVACSSAVAAQGVLYLAFFAEGKGMVTLWVAALLGGAAAALARGSPRTRAIALSSAVFLALTGALLLAGVPVTLWPAAVGRGLLYGWIRMLTVGVPANPTVELLATPLLVAVVGAFGAVRAAFAQSVGTALALITTTQVFALAMTASTLGNEVVWTTILLVVVVLAIRFPGRIAVSPQYICWALAMVVAAGSGALIGTTPYGRSPDRFDPRGLVVPPPLHVPPAVTPLSRLKPQLVEEAPRELFTVQLLDGGDALVDRVHVATLTKFDGVTWSIGERFHVPGARLDLAESGFPVRAKVDITGLAGPFLPVPGQPEQLSFKPTGPDLVEYAGRADTVVVDQSALRGISYVVAARVPGRNLGQAAAGSPADLTELPGRLPGWLEPAARRLTEGAAAPRDQAIALETALRAKPYSVDAPAGHSYPAIQRFLSSGNSPGDGIGSDEQHAAAYALLARSLGLPARVAVGYLLGVPVNGIHHVMNRDAHAWPEVYFPGYGWVPFEATDHARRPPRQWPSQLAAPPDAPIGNPRPRSSPSASPEPPGKTIEPSAGSAQSRVAVTLIMLSIALVLLWTAVTTSIRWHRRRRRHSGTAATRIVGAWCEGLDRFAEAGIWFHPSLTPREMAAAVLADRSRPARSAAQLAELVTVAMFARAEPTEDDADKAWTLARQLRADLWPGRSRSLRLLRLLNPRLIWRPWW